MPRHAEFGNVYRRERRAVLERVIARRGEFRRRSRKADAFGKVHYFDVFFFKPVKQGYVVDVFKRDAFLERVHSERHRRRVHIDRFEFRTVIERVFIYEVYRVRKYYAFKRRHIRERVLLNFGTRRRYFYLFDIVVALERFFVDIVHVERFGYYHLAARAVIFSEIAVYDYEFRAYVQRGACDVNGRSAVRIQRRADRCHAFFMRGYYPA